MDFIENVGPGERGLLVLSSGSHDDRFIQAVYPPKSITDIRGGDDSTRQHLSVSAVRTLGDFNGDGYDDLLVTISDAHGGEYYRFYLGSAGYFDHDDVWAEVPGGQGLGRLYPF